MTITFSMRNVTSELVHTVMLRKFFQMVFVGNDRKSLHIYTATILGASNQKLNQDCMADAEHYANEFLSDFGTLKQFRMRFEFAIGSSDDNDVCSIMHEDLTAGSDYSFLNEIECISNVWGKNMCSIIVNNQNSLLEKYKTISPDANVKGAEEQVVKQTAELSKYSVLWTDQEKSGVERKYFQSLSVAGTFENVSEPQTPTKRDEIAMRKAYAISVPQDKTFPKGIEIVNWVRTTVCFKYSLDDADLNYSIKKENQPDCFFIAPDFTWYFSPVVKSFIDSKNCLVEIKRGISENYDTCQCPIQKTRRTFYRNDKFQNSINPVPNKLTVNFHYWTEEEKIFLRQKYRLAARDIFPRPADFNEISELTIFLDTSDEHNRGNRQFLAGIFLSIALAFGIDSTRLQEIDYCFSPLNRIFTSDILWIAFLVLFSMTLINTPLRLSEASRKLATRRAVLLILSGIWVIVVFGVLRAPWMLPLVNSYKDTIGLCSGFALLLLAGCHLWYLKDKNVNAGKNLFLDMFGKDIL